MDHNPDRSRQHMVCIRLPTEDADVKKVSCGKPLHTQRPRGEITAVSARSSGSERIVELEAWWIGPGGAIGGYYRRPCRI